MSGKYFGFIVAATTILGSLGGVVLNAPEAQASSWLEYRTHCVWRSGKWGMMYKSCSPQTRTCQSMSTVGGGGRTSCTPWQNR